MGLMMRAKVVSPFVRQRVVLLSVKTGREHLVALRELIEAGSVTPAIDRTYPLSAVPDAIRYVAEEHARAKVVITI
jgi:NADPH:quinone reductase-like Zn-dependent oxidoreductase